MATQIYRENLCRRYYASRCSFAFVLTVLYWVAVIVFPFFIAYSTVNFWKKQAFYREQPKIEFTHQAILETYDNNPSGAGTLAWSTYATYNALVGSHYREASIESQELDWNFDGRIDELLVSVNVPLSPADSVHGFTLALFIQGKLSEHVDTTLQSAVFVQGEAGRPVGGYRGWGTLEVRQQEPFSPYGVEQSYSSALVSASSFESVEDCAMDNIMYTQYMRNDSLVFVPTATQFASASPFSSHAGRGFNITVAMRVPWQSIEYTPSLAETIKFAWVQYIAILVVVWFFASWARWFVFRYQLVETMTRNDLQPIHKLHHG